MSSGLVFPTGHRLKVYETIPNHFAWAVLSVDGRTQLLVAAEDYTTFSSAKRGGTTAYRNLLKQLQEKDPTPVRKQKIRWRRLVGGDLPKERQTLPENRR